MKQGNEDTCAVCHMPFEPSQTRLRVGERDAHLSCYGPNAVPAERPTVLVVDDEAEIRGVLREILAPRAYVVLDTGDPEEALRVARSYKGTINTLLTDVVMPGIQGPELAERMRPLRPEMKVLFMSAYDVVHRLKPDAVFLSKPFTVKQLMAQLEAQ